mgnify:CR=1 FL=1
MDPLALIPLWLLSVPVAAQPPALSLTRLEQQRVITPDEHWRLRQGASAHSRPLTSPQWLKACQHGALSRQQCSSLGRRPLSGGGVVSSDFGMRVHPVLGRWLMHSGRDYAAPTGTPVLAVLPGTVVRSGWSGGYGLMVELDHAQQRRRTLYAHLSELTVKPGQWVRQGQQIGNVGSTGLSTGPHLHFELRQQGVSGWKAVDPAELLDRS